MNAIVNVDKNWAIGNKGELLVRISSDLKRFKSLTSGKVVVLGRKTMDTFPGRKPLKNRTNIILSRDKDYVVEGGIVVHSVEELMEELSRENKLNLLLHDGEYLYVHANKENTMYHKRDGGGLLFATVPLDDGFWEPVPFTRLLVYRAGEEVFAGEPHGNEYVKEDVLPLRLEFSLL